MYLCMRPLALFVYFAADPNHCGKLKKRNMSTTKSMGAMWYSAFKIWNQSYIWETRKKMNERIFLCMCLAKFYAIAAVNNILYS